MFRTKSTIATDSPAKTTGTAITSLRALTVGAATVLLSLAVVAPASAAAIAPATSQAISSTSSGTSTDTSTDTSARSYGCVSNYEWNHFYIGNGKNQVEHFFGTRGWTVWSNGYYGVKKYYACGSYYTVVKVKYRWTGSRWVVKNAYRYHR
ncbi:MAG: hypothetical protein ABI720_07205 [Actinomycetes bacterium]